MPPPLMQRARDVWGPPATRKTCIILSLAIISVVVVVVTAVMLSVSHDSDVGPGLEGESFKNPNAAPITDQEMAQILQGVDDSLKNSQDLVDRYRGMSRHEIFKASVSVSIASCQYFVFLPSTTFSLGW